MNKPLIINKVGVSKNHIRYGIAFRDESTEWNFYRNDGNGFLQYKYKGWYLSPNNEIYYREEIILIESILRGLNS